MGTIMPRKPSAVLVTADHTVTTERHINADATSGEIDVTLPDHGCGTNRTVSKVDDSANVVKIYEDAAPDPALLATLTAQGQRVGLYADGGTAYTVRGP